MCQTGCPMPTRQTTNDTLRTVTPLAIALLWTITVVTSVAVVQAGQGDSVASGAPASEATPDDVPLYEQPPRDWLLLRNEPADGEDVDESIEDDGDEPTQVEMYVLPITLTGPDAIEPGQPRAVPENPVPGRSFEVRLADRPQDVFTVYWRDVVDIRLFEQRLIDAAERLVSQGRFDEAFGYYQFLDANYPDFAGVQESLEQFLLREAGSLFSNKQIEHATLLLVELHERNPDHPRLSRALGMAIDTLVERANEEKEYASCRRYLGRLASRYPDHSVVTRWRRQWNDRASAAVRQAQAHAAKGDYGAAHESIHDALDVWPQIEGAAELAARLEQQHRYVAVGVTEVTKSQVPARPTVSWTARRRERLLTRKLIELSTYRPDGATYESPFGEFETTDLGSGLRLNIRSGIAWQPGGATLSTSDVSRHLLAMADASTDVYDPLWADLFSNVSTSTPRSLTVGLTRGYVRPQTVLQTTVLPWNLWHTTDAEVPSIGGYRSLPPTDTGTQFVARANYFAAEAGQADEINERVFTSTEAAVRALQQGRIVAIDRIAPWDISRLRTRDDVALRAYAVPTVHCLVPGRANELTRSRVFRRAIHYGIDRQQILEKWLLRGAEVAGCRVVSGPFPTGYAYDEGVEPREFKPQLGMALAWTALHAIRAAERKAASDGDTTDETTEDAADEADRASATFPELSLAHPINEIATRACRQIREYLRALGVPVRLVPVDPADEWDLSVYDLIYVELSVSEPMVDVSTLFGPGGLIEGNSAFLDQFVRRVELATDSRTARDELFEIHRRVHEDLPVIPLWQLTEHCAIDPRLEGLDAPVASLYDRVEQWRLPAWQGGGEP